MAQLKIVGFVNLEPKKCLIIYPTKEAAILAAKQQEKDNHNKKFIEDLAASIKALALKSKLFAAKRALKLKGYSFKLICEFWSICKKIKGFNVGKPNFLKVKFY